MGECMRNYIPRMYVCVKMCVCMSMCARARVSVCACVCVCACARVCVCLLLFAPYTKLFFRLYFSSGEKTFGERQHAWWNWMKCEAAHRKHLLLRSQVDPSGFLQQQQQRRWRRWQQQQQHLFLCYISNSIFFVLNHGPNEKKNFIQHMQAESLHRFGSDADFQRNSTRFRAGVDSQ